MNYYEYVFHCRRVPSKLTQHAIATHFFGTKDLSEIDFRVEQEGKLVKIRTDMKIDNSFEKEFHTKKGTAFIVKSLRTVEHEIHEYKQGDKVLVSGVIEYGRNAKDVKGKRCPVHLGKFNSNQARLSFKNHIEIQLGVEVPEMQRTSFSRLASMIEDDHIQFNNVIDMDLNVVVVDPAIFNKIAYKSFFQKKSYGFGNLEVIS